MVIPPRYKVTYVGEHREDSHRVNVEAYPVDDNEEVDEDEPVLCFTAPKGSYKRGDLCMVIITKED